jgi:hypothetical protein
MLSGLKTNRIQPASAVIPDVSDDYVEKIGKRQREITKQVGEYRETLTERQNRINRLNNSIFGTHFILPFVPNGERKIDVDAELQKKRLELEGFDVSQFKTK